jgi:8-oxo-dGTP diphosphatase
MADKIDLHSLFRDFCGEHRYVYMCVVSELSGDDLVMAARKGPLLAVDVVIRRKDGTVVLIKRLNPPFKDQYAIPGGFVEYGETVERAAEREAEEETGLKIGNLNLIGVYSDPERDPRGHVISVAFLAEEIGGTLKASTDAKEVVAFKEIPTTLAFDHSRILADAMRLSVVQKP